jgi:hypothetical protein
VPETYRDCQWENVPHQRWVTRYRRVTRTRQEERTRLVTRYRTETRCCVTRTREVFDRNWKADVVLRFPDAAALLPKEVETFNVQLLGDENNPELSVTLKDTVYGYAPIVNVINANTFEVDMQLRPKYTAAQLGEGSLEGVSIVSSNGQNIAIVRDAGTRYRVLSQYQLQLLNPADGTVIGELAWEQNGAKAVQEKTLPTNLAPGQIVQIRLAVQRTSVLLEQPIQFGLNAQMEVEEDANYEAGPFMDPTQAGKFSLNGRGEKLQLWFRDLTETLPQVQTQYQITISDSKGNMLAQKSFNRADLTASEGGRYKLGLKEHFGASAEVLAKFKSGYGLIVNMDIVRQGRKLNPNPFVLKKKVTLAVP